MDQGWILKEYDIVYVTEYEKASRKCYGCKQIGVTDVWIPSVHVGNVSFGEKIKVRSSPSENSRISDFF